MKAERPLWSDADAAGNRVQTSAMSWGGSVFHLTRTNALRFGFAGVIALALLALVGVLIFSGHNREPAANPEGCAGTLTDTGECLGLVTDSATLDSAIRGVAEKILTANQEVEKNSQGYVRVVLLTPLSVARPPAASAMSLDQIKFSLQGAYTALYRANTSAAFGDKHAPAVQLLLVNQGSRQPDNDSLVKQIVELSEDKKHPVRAVVGLGSSFQSTEAMARKLSERKIPMVGAVTSATSFNASAFKTFHSVSPSNEDYASALRDLLAKNSDKLPLQNGVIVYDRNDDPYTRTLNEAFTEVLKDYVKGNPQGYHGGTVDSPATKNVFKSVVTDVCTNVQAQDLETNVVFFAGRVADFPHFVDALAERLCGDKPLTVMVGATGFQLAPEYVDLLDKAKVSVIWASSADAPSWILEQPGTPRGFKDFRTRHRDLGFKDEDLNDGFSVMYHDAVASAMRVIRVAAQSNAVPALEDVQAQFDNLGPASAVRGASGDLWFAQPAPGDGRARGKVVVYRQLGKTGPRLPANIAPYLIP
ncbi:ABC transporter substrate-binding protein [Micromonospora zamorensis]|uniref:ABC transporter substrate-binding protein n=1 Tax=Micromonospora zamorensis TaxID=709883 RepID=UPI003D91677B